MGTNVLEQDKIAAMLLVLAVASVEAARSGLDFWKVAWR
jgi:hypothetical protein